MNGIRSALEAFAANYQHSYPTIAGLWHRHWMNIIPIFDYPEDIRRVIYPTNAIESLNYTLKKSLKTKGALPGEDALLKVLYLATANVHEKWTMLIKNRKRALNQFAQLLGDRPTDRWFPPNS